MAELALGVLGLAGIFSATLDVWSFVDAGQGYAQSFTRLRTRLDLQRTLFVNWGKSVGFGTEEGYHPKLDHPDTQPVVRKVLTETYLILSETDGLALKYGVRMLDESEERRPVPIPRRIRESRLTTSIFRPKYEEFRLRLGRRIRGDNTEGNYPQGGVELAAELQREAIRDRQRNTSIWKKTKWAIRDEDKMEKLVRDLAELISGLRTLTADIVDVETEREIAAQTVSDIDSVDSLRQIEEASLEASPLSVSVSERILSLESRASGVTTFYSARSRLSQLPVFDSVYGTSQPSPGWLFPETLSSAGARNITIGIAQNHSLETVDEPSEDDIPITGLPLNQPHENFLGVFHSEPTQSPTDSVGDIPWEGAEFSRGYLPGRTLQDLEDELGTGAATDGPPGPYLWQSPTEYSVVHAQNDASMRLLVDEHIPDRRGTMAGVDAHFRHLSGNMAWVDEHMHGHFKATVTGPPHSPYSAGKFPIQYWVSKAVTLKFGDLEEEEVAVLCTHVRFLTPMCHPLVDTDGDTHVQFLLPAALDKKRIIGEYHKLPKMVARVLSHGGWTAIFSERQVEAEQVRVNRVIDHMQWKARKWSMMHGEHIENYDLEYLQAAEHSTLREKQELARSKLRQRVWEAQGAGGLTVTFPGYPYILMWEGKFHALDTNN